MAKLIDLTGQVFDRLMVLGRAPNSGHNACWRCECRCGTKTIVEGGHLRSGGTRSCGCYHLELVTIHGGRKTGTYRSWTSMIGRCRNHRRLDYPRYGGRGIRVCDRWMSFELFLKDMGSRPSSDHSLDRIDNAGDYEPNNCRWATRFEQQNNCRSNRIIKHDGKEQTLAQWSRVTGIGSTTLRSRLNRGWPVSKALTEPVGAR